MSKALEAAEAAILEIIGPVIAHPEAGEDVIARMKARQVKAAKGFARAAILAFLREVDASELGAAVRDAENPTHAAIARALIKALTRLAEGPAP